MGKPLATRFESGSQVSWEMFVENRTIDSLGLDAEITYAYYVLELLYIIYIYMRGLVSCEMVSFVYMQ